jgi:hypothetical protein
MFDIINKKILPPSGPVHYMMPCIRITYSQRAGHRQSLAEITRKVNRRLDP